VTDRATAYAKAVVAGEVISCKWVLLACKRHLRDLKRKDLVWNVEESEKALDFCENVSHYKGPTAGETFIPEPWECFLIGSVFGWFQKNGLRRFRYAYIEVPRKNGKTFIGATVSTRELMTEAGAEVYTAATKEDQAKIAWNDGVKLIKHSKVLQAELTPRVKEIRFEKRDGKWRPLGADSKTLDGLNPSFVLCDELHAWPKRELWDVIDDGMGSRDNPLMLEITTAGFNQTGICFEHRTHICKILEQKDQDGSKYEDDAWFGIIYTVDNPDDWQNEDEWRKANPNIGVSKTWDFMRGQCEQAKKLPSKLNAFLNKQLNIWTQAQEAWLDVGKWDKLKREIDEEQLENAPCYGGLDLASVSDIACFALYWPEWKHLRVWSWIPSENATERQRNDKVPYLAWERVDRLELTPGNVIDYDAIESRIVDCSQKYKIKAIGFDRWNAQGLVQKLIEHGVNLLEFRQTIQSMSGPSKEFEKLVTGKQLSHDGQPSMRWMLQNVQIKHDHAGNYKPDKGSSNEKIDGIIASIMAIGTSMSEQEEEQAMPNMRTWDDE
jgi:phage terminase large subunit-like protein